MTVLRAVATAITVYGALWFAVCWAHHARTGEATDFTAPMALVAVGAGALVAAL